MTRVWIEAAINGPWGKTRQPGIPVTASTIIADGVACARAGAAIIHLHAYDERTGQQKDDWRLYAEVIEGIRAQCDAIVYPTIPIAGSSYANGAMTTARDRYAHIEELAKRGLATVSPRPSTTAATPFPTIALASVAGGKTMPSALRKRCMNA